MIGRHNMLWRREPYRHHLGPSSDTRDDDRLARNDHARIDVVASGDRINQEPGILPPGHPFGDRPDRIPDPDDHNLLGGPRGTDTYVG